MEIVVNTTAIVDSSQVFVTAKTYVEEPLYIKDITTEELFVVAMPSVSDKDIEFSWFIVNVK
jgi:hypothetical protein